MTITNNILEAIYTPEICRKIYNGSCWGDEPENTIAIDGAEAMKHAEALGIVIGGAALSAGVAYIFRWNEAHTRLVPYHVTMKIKTQANLARGSLKYGFDKIMRETF